MERARKLFRSAAKWALVAVVGGIAISVAGQWFIQVATDKGWYRHAGQRWDSIVTVLLSWLPYLHSPQMYVLAAVLTAFTGGLWLDKMLALTEGMGTPLIRPRQDWDVVYRKVRAMQKRLKECEAAGYTAVPADLPYDVLSLHASLKKWGFAIPDRQPEWPPEDYYQSNWAYLNCIAPFMRDKHKREARASAKHHLASIQP